MKVLKLQTTGNCNAFFSQVLLFVMCKSSFTQHVCDRPEKMFLSLTVCTDSWQQGAQLVCVCVCVCVSVYEVWWWVMTITLRLSTISKILYHVFQFSHIPYTGLMPFSDLVHVLQG